MPMFINFCIQWKILLITNEKSNQYDLAQLKIFQFFLIF